MSRFKPYSNPILILSDPPEATTGLGRVCRDLASLLATMPQFRVATLGRGAVARSHFPWQQYSYPEHAQWGEDHLAGVCHDFFRDDYGIVFSNWDASRLLWLTNPEYLPPKYAREYGPGRNWELWGYVPVDGRFGIEIASSIWGYKRVIAASEWGKGEMIGHQRADADWIPHGIWMDKFQPKCAWRNVTRPVLGWDRDHVYLGCNMSNQSRKDWPVAFECASLLQQIYGNRFHFWAHTDLAIHYWNLYALAADYSLNDCLEITTNLTDEQLALRYSACDCTILPSAGEGFGYPIAESMACGTPCVVTDYAASQELVQPDCRVAPVAYRIDTQHNVQRAVLSVQGFAQAAAAQIERKRNDWDGTSQGMRAQVAHLGWENLQWPWKKWLLKGLL